MFLGSRPSPNPGAGPDLPDKVIPIRHYFRWLAVLVVILLAAMLAHALVTRDGLQWNVVWSYLFAQPILLGVVRTLVLTVVSTVVASVIGAILAVMALSPNPLLRATTTAYVWLFRGTPVLVQLLFWYYMAAVFPTISFGIPFGPEWLTLSSTKVINQFTAAILGLGLAAGAYMAEIIRGGITAVDAGQIEAGEALGMTRLLLLRRIVFPQALRVIIPPAGNEFISTLKASSIVIVIAYAELMTSVQLIYSQTFETIPLLIVATIWYLLMTTVLTFGQRRLERRLSRGYRRKGGPTKRVTNRTLEPPAGTPAETRADNDD
jgi:polar amino acid transport system permease protein